MWHKSLFTIPLALSGFLGAVGATQVPLRSSQPGWNGKVVQSTNSSTGARFMGKEDSYDHGLFTPLGDMSALSEHEFTRMGHPAFPRHGVRIKKTKFCDGTVNAYTGYIDVEARHIFFYFFESRNDPAKDDVIFWTNGGPGGSSSIGLFFELGPCRIPDDNGPVFHPESWNNNASVMFVDQPIGVGFSYADYGEQVATTEEGAKDIAAFLAVFFENFKQYQGRPLHMAGESYGGRYIPLYAAAVYDQNARLVEAGLTPVNLSSVAIGNGMTDPFAVITSYYDLVCMSAELPPRLDISTCVRMKQVLPRCKKMIQKSCLDVFDGIGCEAAWNFCDLEITQPYFLAGMNPYDISKKCSGKLEETLCYPEAGPVNKYLDQPEVREMLGVDPAIEKNLPPYSVKVNTDFMVALDHLHQSTAYITALLERGVDVLVYVGTYDFACNWIANQRWTLDLEWSGQEEFVGQELKVWHVDGKRAGRFRKAKGLMYATIEGAGHMAPYDKPKESLALINRWLYQRDL